MFIANLLASTGHALSEWRQKHQAYAELMALDDRALADIGIHRSQIPALVARQEQDKASDGEFAPAFATRKLAGGHTWFPWFPSL
jgi:uncharacterized protein YjiS (DUF1127 family)